MKPRRYLMAAAAVIVAAAAFAEPKTDIAVSYGAFPTMNYFGGYRHHYDLRNAWGAVNVSFAHNFFTPGLKIGLSYTFSSSPGLRGRADGGAEVDAVWHALMASVRYPYYSRGRFTVYGHGGAGVLIGYFSPSWRDSYNQARFAFQISPICLAWRVAGPVSAFMEAGMGVEGIVQAGVRASF